MLPIEMEVTTWGSLPWEIVETREQLIEMRTHHIRRHGEDVKEATLRLQRLREQNRDAFDERHVLRNTPLAENDPVLLHDTIRDDSVTSGNKLRMRWVGPYRIAQVKNNGAYQIKEFDGTVLRESIAGNRLKRFYFRAGEETSWNDVGFSATIPAMSEQRQRGTTRRGTTRTGTTRRGRGRGRGGGESL
jgi:hypothetical protein